MSSQPPTVRRAVAADLKSGAAALASAFSTDPVFNWLVANDVERRLGMFFSGSLGSAIAKSPHIVDVAVKAETAQAVALWHDVDDWKRPDPPLHKLIPAVFPIFKLRTIRAARLSEMMKQGHPTDPHRYLAFVGVHADHKGTGLGGALLTSMVNECDELGLPAYLESSNPVNDALYYRFGFVDHHKVALPNGAPPVTAMWRDPR